MAQSMTRVAAGRVNRRFLFLALILAALSAVLAYVALSRSGDDGGGGTGADISVVVATQEIPASTVITADMVEIRELPEGAVGELPITDLDSVIGEIAIFPIAADEPLLTSNLVGLSQTASNDVLSHQLVETQRGMAITAEAVVGAGGLVLPGDYVDVFLVPDKLKGQDHEGAFLIAENVEVIAVEQTLIELPPAAPGLQEEDNDAATVGPGEQRVRGGLAEPLPQALTVTLMLTPEQASNVFCGDQLGTLRLAVRAFGDPGSAGLLVEKCVIAAEDS